MKKAGTTCYFVTPGLILYTIFAVIPVFYIYFPVFYRLVGLGEINFVGIKNFVTLFTDSRFPTFFNAIKTILNT